MPSIVLVPQYCTRFVMSRNVLQSARLVMPRAASWEEYIPCKPTLAEASFKQDGAQSLFAGKSFWTMSP